MRIGEFDLIYAHCSYCGIIGLFRRKLPLVVSLLASDQRSVNEGYDNISFRERIESLSGKFVARYADNIIVKSQEMAEWIPFCKNVQVIPNDVGFNNFKPMDKELELSKFDLPRK
jgi:hypothetical protein